MTVYTRAQIEGFARTAGLNEKDAKTASYIAMSESSGDTTKSNTYVEKGVRYYVDGLWQISTIHGLGSRESMRDPMTNARAMATLHKRKVDAGKPPWEDWDSSKDGENGWGSKVLGWLNAIDNPFGVFDKFKPDKEKEDALNEQLGDNIDGAIDGALATAKAIGRIATTVEAASMWVSNPHNWLRLAYVGLGAGVVVVGLAKIVGYDSGLSPVKALAKSGKPAQSQQSPKKAAWDLPVADEHGRVAS